MKISMLIAGGMGFNGIYETFEKACRMSISSVCFCWFDSRCPDLSACILFLAMELATYYPTAKAD